MPNLHVMLLTLINLVMLMMAVVKAPVATDDGLHDRKDGHCR